MQRPARAFLAPFLVQRVGDLERIGVELDHRVEARAVAVDGFDAGEVRFDEGAGGEPAGLHLRLDFK